MRTPLRLIVTQINLFVYLSSTNHFIDFVSIIKPLVLYLFNYLYLLLLNAVFNLAFNASMT